MAKALTVPAVWLQTQLLVWILPASGQLPPSCLTHSPVQQALAENVSAAQYNTIGADFVRRNETGCAVAAFQQALRLDPSFAETRFNLGMALMQNGDFKAAADHLREFSQSVPKSFQARMAYGGALAAVGKYEAAAREFTAAQDLDARSHEALQALADAWRKAGKPEAAIPPLRRAFELQPDNLELQLNLGAAYADSGLVERATEVLEEAAAKHRRAASAHFNLATLHARQQRYENAAAALRQALQIEPGHEEAHLALAKVLVRQHRYSEALAQANGYLARRAPPSREFDARHVEGVSLRQLGRLEEAERALRRANELNPDHADVCYNLGFVLLRRGALGEARRQLEKARQLDPDNPDIRFQLANVLHRLRETAAARQEFEEFERRKQSAQQANEAAMTANRGNEKLQQGDAAGAVELYRDALGLDPNNAETYYNLAIALDRLGQLDEKRIALEQAVALKPDFYRAHNDLGLAYLAESRHQEAQAALERALELNPDFAEAASNLGSLLAQQGLSAQAAELFRSAIALQPEYAQAHLNLGLVRADQGRLQEAEGQIRQALLLAPNDTRAQTSLGLVLMRRGRLEEAARTFRIVTVAQPGSAEAHLNLGMALVDQYDLEAALESFAHAARLAPDSVAARYNKGRLLYDLGRHEKAASELERAAGIPQTLYLLALIEKQRGSLELARELLQQVVAAAPRDADAHYQLGLNYALDGDQAQAVEHWKRAVAIDTEHGQALYNLARELRDMLPDEARGYRERFRKRQKQRGITNRAEMLASFALASANARDWPQAITQLEEAIDVCGQCPTKADLYKQLGLVYARTGNLERAEPALRRAYELLPTDSEIDTSLRLIASYKRRQGSSP